MRCVLTSGPSCGKTTTILDLEQRGFMVLHESARQVIKERIGRVADEKERLWRQREIFRRQLEKEENIKDYNGEVFLDRSLLDGISYCRLLLGYVPEDIDKFDYSDRYEIVFALDKLPFKDDGLRVERDSDEAEMIHNMLIEDYEKRGYNPISVPVMRVEDRSDYILDKLRRIKYDRVSRGE